MTRVFQTRRFNCELNMITLPIIDVIVFIAHAAGTYGYFHTTDALNMEDSRHRCEELEGSLVLPRDRSINDVIARHLADRKISYSWIGAQIIPTFWHWADGVPFYDQGCYSQYLHSASNPNGRLFLSHTQCLLHCERIDYRFGAFQEYSETPFSLPLVNCYCIQQIRVSDRLPEEQCRTTCKSLGSRCGSRVHKTVRVFTTGIRAYVSWTWGNAITPDALCARDAFHDDTHILQRYRCRQETDFKCNDSRRDSNSQMTWFEAHAYCHEKEERLAAGWSEVKAWTWSNNEDLIFTSWAADQPDFTHGTCITISQSGEWRTANCSAMLHGTCTTPGQPLHTTEPPEENDDVTEEQSSHIDGGTSNVTAIVVGLLISVLVVAGLVVSCVIYRRMKQPYKRPVVTYSHAPRFSKSDIHMVPRNNADSVPRDSAGDDVAAAAGSCLIYENITANEDSALGKRNRERTSLKAFPQTGTTTSVTVGQDTPAITATVCENNPPVSAIYEPIECMSELQNPEGGREGSETGVKRSPNASSVAESISEGVAPAVYSTPIPKPDRNPIRDVTETPLYESIDGMSEQHAGDGRGGSETGDNGSPSASTSTRASCAESNEYECIPFDTNELYDSCKAPTHDVNETTIYEPIEDMSELQHSEGGRVGTETESSSEGVASVGYSMPGPKPPRLVTDKVRSTKPEAADATLASIHADVATVPHCISGGEVYAMPVPKHKRNPAPNDSSRAHPKTAALPENDGNHSEARQDTTNDSYPCTTRDDVSSRYSSADSDIGLQSVYELEQVVK